MGPAWPMRVNEGLGSASLQRLWPTLSPTHIMLRVKVEQPRPGKSVGSGSTLRALALPMLDPTYVKDRTWTTTYPAL